MELWKVEFICGEFITSINNNTPEKYFNPINTNSKNKTIFELSLS